MNLGENIRFYRKQKNMSAKELGEKINVSAQAILQYERNERKPSMDKINSISSVLGITPSVLLGWESDTSNENVSIDNDIRKIERAKNRMPKNKQKDMINMLKIAFSDYFDDED